MIAIDLGSNSCRFLHVECESGEKIGEFEVIVKTADNLHLSGKISLKAQDRIINAIQEAKKEIAFTDEPVIAVTTEAMRQASNSQEVLSEIEKQTGILFEIIDGDREAFYTLKAVKYRLQSLEYTSESFVLIDIGGGSTEVIFSFNSELVSQSFKVGIVTIAQQCNTQQEVRSFLDRELEAVKNFIKKSYERYEKPQLLVATAGTPTTISAYLLGMDYQTYDPDKINGYVLTCKGITQALHELMAMDEETRSRYVGVGRENLIAAGIIIVEAFYQILGFKSGIVIDDGLREGLARTYCES